MPPPPDDMDDLLEGRNDLEELLDALYEEIDYAEFGGDGEVQEQDAAERFWQESYESEASRGDYAVRAAERKG